MMQDGAGWCMGSEKLWDQCIVCAAARLDIYHLANMLSVQGWIDPPTPRPPRPIFGVSLGGREVSVCGWVWVMLWTILMN